MHPFTSLRCPFPCRPHLLLGGLLFSATYGTACSYEAQVSRALRPSPDSGAPALAPAPGCNAAQVPAGCGDPCGDGVAVSGDVSTNTVWDCPVYTLPAPIFVHGSGAEPTRLVIAPGTVIKGHPGSLEEGRLPGALIVTRSGRLEARGTRAQPIVFTSAAPPGERAPGDWGGVVLLGRAPTNVPADFENSGNRAGEMFIEGLPRVENTTYGTGVDAEPAADAGALSGAPPDAGRESIAQPNADPNHDCGTLRFVRIEFAGFAVSDTNELNGLTVGGCGRYTVLDYIQVHLGSDDGIEFFGGTADLKHAVVTGAKDDSLDWDQGWQGRVQFLAIQQHDDSGGANGQGDNGFEGDGYADPERTIGTASSPSMYNVTLLSSRSSVRGLRLREGTELVLHNAIIASAPGGPAEGLIELSDAATVDQLTLGRTRVNHSIFSGPWPRSGQADSNGTQYLEEDYFTAGEGSLGNTVLSVEQTAELLPGAFELDSPHWVPVRGSYASSDWAVPSDSSGLSPFFDVSANFRGAFDPSGDDWTAGWTAYPAD